MAAKSRATSRSGKGKRQELVVLETRFERDQRGGADRRVHIQSEAATRGVYFGKLHDRCGGSRKNEAPFPAGSNRRYSNWREAAPVTRKKGNRTALERKRCGGGASS